MTAAHALPEQWDDQPVPYQLTEAGWSTTSELLDVGQASELSGFCRDYVNQLARAGKIQGHKVGQEWLLERASLLAYVEERRIHAQRLRERAEERRERPRLVQVREALPAAPLIRQVMLRGGPGACGAWGSAALEKAWERALRDGWLTERAADELAVRLLGMVPREIWPEID